MNDQSDYMVGKLAAVAIPHWFFSFLDIMMYPSIPQLAPQLKHDIIYIKLCQNPYQYQKKICLKYHNICINVRQNQCQIKLCPKYYDSYQLMSKSISMSKEIMP